MLYIILGLIGIVLFIAVIIILKKRKTKFTPEEELNEITKEETEVSNINILEDLDDTFIIESEEEELEEDDEFNITASLDIPERIKKLVEDDDFDITASLEHIPKEIKKLEDDDLSSVSFTAITPKNIKKGKRYLLRVAMYEVNHEEIVQKIIEEFQEEVQKISKSSFEIQTGKKVTLKLFTNDFPFTELEESMIWNKEACDFSFLFQVPKEYDNDDILFFIKILIDDVLVGKMEFLVKLEEKDLQNIKLEMNKIKKAFISYASQNRDEVLTCIQGMQKVCPDIDFFLDVLKLRSGNHWEEKLWEEIEKSDVFYLFWSTYAKDSPWVMKELECALKTKGLSFIEPVPLESPKKCPPPKSLESLHFNDWEIYFKEKK